MKKSKAIGLSVVASICLGYSANAAEANLRLNETLVSTKGFETSIREESKNVIVLNQEDIQDKGYTSVSDILKNAPYINISGSSVGNNGSTIDLRGQGGNANSNVKIMINDVPLSVLDLSHSQPPIDSIAPSQIERIEILPGSGSVLYGNGAIGGVINIITKADVQKEYADMQALYKSYNTKSISGGLGRNINDKIYLNINFSQDRGNGYREKDKFFTNNFDTSIAYNITDSQTVAFLLRTNISNGVASDGITKAQLDANRKQTGAAITTYNNVTTDYTLKYDFKINDNLNFKAKAYYQEINKDETVEGVFSGFKIDHWNAPFKEVKQGISLKQQVKHNNDAGNLVVGYDFLDNRLKRTIDTTIISRGAPTTWMDTYNDFSKQTHSVFAMEDYTIANKVKLNAGARYEFAKYDTYRSTKTLFSAGKTIALSTNKDESNYAYNLGASYIISDTDNVYVNYERGYVSPSPTQLVNLNARNNSFPSTGYEANNLKSQTGNNIEVGYKGYTLGSYINATVFYNQNSDEIALSYVSNPHAQYSYHNIDKTQRIGGELFLQQSFSKLSFTESATYINSKVLKGDYKGQKVALVPDVKATIGADYEVINGLSFGAKVNYTGKYLEKNSKDKSSNIDAPAVVTADVSAKYNAVENLNVVAGVNNIFNAKYNIVSDSSGTGNFIPANGVTYYVGLNYKF